jgi:hypothetical protein
MFKSETRDKAMRIGADDVNLPEAVSYQLSALSYQLSAPNCQPRTVAERRCWFPHFSSIGKL